MCVNQEKKRANMIPHPSAFCKNYRQNRKNVSTCEIFKHLILIVFHEKRFWANHFVLFPFQEQKIIKNKKALSMFVFLLHILKCVYLWNMLFKSTK